MNDLQQQAQAALRRRRAALDAATANIRVDLAEHPDSEMELLVAVMAANMSGSHLAVSGVASLAMIDLAKAQGEIVRLQAELDGEKAAHAQCPGWRSGVMATFRRVWRRRLAAVDWDPTLSAIGLFLILILAGCWPGDAGPNGDRTPQPGHTTIVTPSPSPTPAPSNPLRQAGPAPSWLCHDSSVRGGTNGDAACASHNGVAEGP